MKHRSLLAAVVALIATMLAQNIAAQSRIQVSELKPLLIRALENGSAQGVLVGIGANYMRQRFDTNLPIEVDVRVLNALPEAGCSRLEVTTRQKNVLENSRRSNKDLTYQISYCRDGRLAHSK
jgi:hypothetical protein